MAGKLCNGVSGYSAGELMNSKAYCEGRKAKYDNWPSAATNPHLSGSETNVCWEAGYDSVSNPGDPAEPGRDCCAQPARVGS